MTQSPCCWKAKWVTLTDLCKSSQDGLGQLPWPGQKWEWECWTWAEVRSDLDWLTTATPTTLGVPITALRWEKLPAGKCMGVTLDQKCAEMHQPLHGRALGGSALSQTSVERRGAAPAAPGTMDLQGMPGSWLQPKDNSPGLSLWTAECCPGRHRKPFHILGQFRNKYSDSNVLWP